MALKIRTNVKVSDGDGDDPKKKKKAPASENATESDRRTIYSVDNRADTHSKAHTIKKGEQIAKSMAKSSGDYASGAAPRVGGKASATQGGVPTVSSKKLIKISKKNVNKNSASPQARRSARKLY